MGKKLKIAIYSGTIPSTTFIENLIKGISMKYEVLLFGKLLSKPRYTSKNIKYFPIDSNKFKTLIVTKWRTFLLLILYPKRFKILLSQIKQHKGIYNKYQWWSRYAPVLLHLPDVFHIQWAKDVDKWCFLKDKLGCKLVLSLRGAHINYSPIANPILAEMYKTYFPKINAFHSVSDAIGLEAQKYGVDKAKITKVYSIIPKSTFDLFREPKVIKDNHLKIISVGRYHWKKGYSVALDACKILKDQGILFTYTIVAAGSVAEELLFQRHQLNLEREVIFLDAMPQTIVFKKMQESDVLLLPSLEEGIANVVLEAMAIGLPVISSNCGGMSEVVKNKETGWLVDTFDSKEISIALKQVQNLPYEKLKLLVENAFKLVKKKFNESDNILKFQKIYEALNDSKF